MRLSSTKNACIAFFGKYPLLRVWIFQMKTTAIMTSHTPSPSPTYLRTSLQSCTSLAGSSSSKLIGFRLPSYRTIEKTPRLSLPRIQGDNKRARARASAPLSSWPTSVPAPLCREVLLHVAEMRAMYAPNVCSTSCWLAASLQGQGAGA